MENRTLLQKYGIPISHLDFGYVKNCKDTKELERIVAILRSGEEGFYPELTKCAEDKLRELKPQSKALRTEEQILTKNNFSTKEWEDHNAWLIEWSAKIKNKDKILSTIQKKSEKTDDVELPPIRKCGKVTTNKDAQSSSTTVSTLGSATRVAATNYSQWDKYDADAEILKMDLEEERVKENVERMNKLNQKNSSKTEATDKDKSKDKSSIYSKLTQIERETLSEDFKNRGNECFKSKEYASAIQHYSRCIQIYPTVAAYNNRAITNIKLLKFADALSDCEECLRREPANLKALLRKAESCLGLGRKLDAYQCYEQVKVIEPENAIALKALEKMRFELGEVAPSHATRIKIIEADSGSVETVERENLKNRQKSNPTPKPVVDYDLTELIKPTNVVKSKFVKTMENLGKLTPNKPKQTTQRNQPLNETPQIKLSIEEPMKRVQTTGKCLIQEL